MRPINTNRVVLWLVAASFCAVASAQDSIIKTSRHVIPDFDSQFIPETAVFGAVAYPAHLAKQSGMELMPWEIVAAFGKKEFGIDPLTIKQVVAIVEKPTGMESPPGYGFILHFDEPAKLNDQIMGRLEEGDYRGMRMYTARDTMEPSVLVVDDVTILVGSEEFIKSMSSANQDKSRLVKLMNSSDNQTAISAYVVVAQMRDFINPLIDQVSDATPPPLKPFLEIPELLESAEWVQELHGDFKSRLTLHAEGSDEAERLDKIIADGLAMGKQMLLAQLIQQMDTNDPVQAATIQYADRIGDFVQTKLTPSRNGNQLIFEASQGMASTPVLMAMLLPAVQQVRSAARRTDSANRVRQLAIAVHNYHDANGHMPNNVYDEDGKPLLSWRVQLLPYLEAGNLYDEFRLDEPWDSAHNRKLIERMPDFLISPSVDLPLGKTIYLGFSGKDTIFDGSKKVRLQDIHDGTSNTILYVEADPEFAQEWTKPVDLAFDRNDPLKGVGRTIRPAGFVAAFMDASVRTIDPNIDAETMRKMVLPADGE